uniref:Uncharacterized protein n=1 Tax=Oryza sativa subsp. japonica TaxID=39947 RepID=Q6Z4M8_ORYSJ|nr:hypothetical protein [Oryza sativa Japonica Group]
MEGAADPTLGPTPFRRVPRPTLIEGVPRGYRGQPPPLSLNTLGRGEGSRHSTLGPTLLEGVPRGFGAASSLQT